MNKALLKYVFHEVKLACFVFRAILDDRRAVLSVEDESGRTDEVPLMGSGLPSLFHREAWTVRNRDLGSGWALCYDSAHEPIMYLGDLSDVDVAQLSREFGLHVDFSEELALFSDSTDARSLKRIVAEEPDRAALFRKKAKWLDAWLGRIASYGPDVLAAI
ncbi:MAG: hypothetical protein QHD01_02730 [Bradyrhizobium sp.]|uniref:hypothetical protein n=1 Tax=Bradyrhizobium sp. TaxID=376 RepID=UPI0029B60D1B|nr:hypothetical protein [Bradyrhizobium sp.]MDX3965499.1 hypothetical protein [Bradyrhizobium sp.]